MQHYKNTFLALLLLTASLTHCVKEVDNLFASMKYGPYTAFTAIAAIASLADYFTTQAKIDRNEVIVQNFRAIKEAIIALDTDSPQEIIESINQQLGQFEQKIGHSADMFIHEYAVMKDCWNDLYTSYANQSNKELKAHLLHKLKLSLHELDCMWRTKLNRTYESKGSSKAYAGIYTVLCAAIGLIWYQEKLMIEVRNAQPFFLFAS